MIDIEKIKLEIIERLKPLNPSKIILFGSYAYGTPHKDSDIDLYVVTNDDFMPQDWKERSQIYLEYSRKLRNLQKEIPIDIIVHTKKMYEKFKDLNSSFYRYSILKGQILC
jgi:predicted nucleotidyltransferase